MTYKTLGQVNPGATTATTLYTVPGGKSAVTSSLIVCNQAGTLGTYRIAVRPAGESLAAKHYLTYDCGLAANSSDEHVIGLTLAATDVVTVYASSASFSFGLWGNES